MGCYVRGEKQHGVFCPGWQIFVGCFVWGVKKWHVMFCPGMFCPALEQYRSAELASISKQSEFKISKVLLYTLHVLLSGVT